MTLVRDEGRALGTVEVVADIQPIAGADAIEAAQIRGWTVVVRKGEFQVGDPVVYLEIDTALPLDDLRYAFLAPRGAKEVDGREYHVLKTARLRGTYSQGLAFPLAMFPEVGEASPGTDVTEALDLHKWEAPVPAGGAGEQVGPFLLAYADKTDSERAQNLTTVWAQIQGHDWVATEKVDGTSCTILRDEEGRLRVCGRNWEIAEGPNLYWDALRRSGIDSETLAPGDVIQAEIIGPGIQGNRLGLDATRLVIFTVARGGQHLPRGAWPQWALEMAVPVLDLELPASAALAVEQANGLTSRLSPPRLAEGVVWHTADGEVVPELGRATFKAISNAYLAKER